MNPARACDMGAKGGVSGTLLSPSWKTGRSHSSLFKSGSSGCIVHMSACRRPPRSSLRTKCMVKPSVALPRACTHKIGHPCPLSRDPRIPQACIMFALLRVVCFLRPRCAPGSRFPCGLALGSHLVLFPFRPLASTILRPPRIYWELVSLTFPCGRKNRGGDAGTGCSLDWLKMKNLDAPAVKREEEEDWGKGR